MSRIISAALFLCISVGVTAQAQQGQPKIVKINDSTYMAPLGANVYLVTTPAGNIVIIAGISLWKEPGTQIIAQRNYVKLVNYVARLEGFFGPATRRP